MDYQNPMAPIPGANVNTAINAQAAEVPTPAMAPIPGGAPGGVTAGVIVPGQAQQPGMFQQGGALQIGLGAVQTLGNLWNSFQQQKLAKESLSLQKESYNTNLSNQRKTYNTALEDRIRARYATEGRSGEADAKIAENTL